MSFVGTVRARLQRFTNRRMSQAIDGPIFGKRKQLRGNQTKYANGIAFVATCAPQRSRSEVYSRETATLYSNDSRAP